MMIKKVGSGTQRSLLEGSLTSRQRLTQGSNRRRVFGRFVAHVCPPPFVCAAPPPSRPVLRQRAKAHVFLWPQPYPGKKSRPKFSRRALQELKSPPRWNSPIPGPYAFPTSTCIRFRDDLEGSFCRPLFSSVLGSIRGYTCGAGWFNNGSYLFPSHLLRRPRHVSC